MLLRLTRFLRVSLLCRGRQQPINEARVGGLPNHNGGPAQSDSGRCRQQPINEARVGGIPNGRPAQRNRGRTPRIRCNEAMFHFKFFALLRDSISLSID
jgi:hypothetical protein